MVRIIKSVSLTPNFADLAEKYHVSLTEACRVGIGIILAEQGIADYDANLNLYRKMRGYQTQLQETLRKIDEKRGG